jgi:hypothetical protein
MLDDFYASNAMSYNAEEWLRENEYHTAHDDDDVATWMPSSWISEVPSLSAL